MDNNLLNQNFIRNFEEFISCPIYSKLLKAFSFLLHHAAPQRCIRSIWNISDHIRQCLEHYARLSRERHSMFDKFLALMISLGLFFSPLFALFLSPIALIALISLSIITVIAIALAAISKMFVEMLAYLCRLQLPANFFSSFFNISAALFKEPFKAAQSFFRWVSSRLRGEAAPQAQAAGPGFWNLFWNTAIDGSLGDCIQAARSVQSALQRENLSLSALMSDNKTEQSQALFCASSAILRCIDAEPEAGVASFLSRAADIALQTSGTDNSIENPLRELLQLLAPSVSRAASAAPATEAWSEVSAIASHNQATLTHLQPNQAEVIAFLQQSPLRVRALVESLILLTGPTSRRAAMFELCADYQHFLVDNDLIAHEALPDLQQIFNAVDAHLSHQLATEQTIVIQQLIGQLAPIGNVVSAEQQQIRRSYEARLQQRLLQELATENGIWEQGAYRLIAAALTHRQASTIDRRAGFEGLTFNNSAFIIPLCKRLQNATAEQQQAVCQTIVAALFPSLRGMPLSAEEQHDSDCLQRLCHLLIQHIEEPNELIPHITLEMIAILRKPAYAATIRPVLQLLLSGYYPLSIQQAQQDRAAQIRAGLLDRPLISSAAQWEEQIIAIRALDEPQQNERALQAITTLLPHLTAAAHEQERTQMIRDIVVLAQNPELTVQQAAAQLLNHEVYHINLQPRNWETYLGAGHDCLEDIIQLSLYSESLSDDQLHSIVTYSLNNQNSSYNRVRHCAIALLAPTAADREQGYETSTLARQSLERHPASLARLCSRVLLHLAPPEGLGAPEQEALEHTLSATLFEVMQSSGAGVQPNSHLLIKSLLRLLQAQQNNDTAMFRQVGLDLSPMLAAVADKLVAQAADNGAADRLLLNYCHNVDRLFNRNMMTQLISPSNLVYAHSITRHYGGLARLVPAALYTWSAAEHAQPYAQVLAHIVGTVAYHGARYFYNDTIQKISSTYESSLYVINAAQHAAEYVTPSIQRVSDWCSSAVNNLCSWWCAQPSQASGHTQDWMNDMAHTPALVFSTQAAAAVIREEMAHDAVPMRAASF